MVDKRMHQRRDIKSDDDSLVNVLFLRKTKALCLFFAEEAKLLTQLAKKVDSFKRFNTFLTLIFTNKLSCKLVTSNWGVRPQFTSVWGQEDYFEITWCKLTKKPRVTI